MRRRVVLPARQRGSEEHTSELQSHSEIVCRLLIEKKSQSRSTKLTQPSPPPRIRFFFNDTATTEIYPLSLHDALPISQSPSPCTATRRAPSRCSAQR